MHRRMGFSIWKKSSAGPNILYFCACVREWRRENACACASKWQFTRKCVQEFFFSFSSAHNDINKSNYDGVGATTTTTTIIIIILIIIIIIYTNSMAKNYNIHIRTTIITTVIVMMKEPQ